MSSGVSFICIMCIFYLSSSWWSPPASSSSRAWRWGCTCRCWGGWWRTPGWRWCRGFWTAAPPWGCRCSSAGCGRETREKAQCDPSRKPRITKRAQTHESCLLWRNIFNTSRRKQKWGEHTAVRKLSSNDFSKIRVYIKCFQCHEHKALLYTHATDILWFYDCISMNTHTVFPPVSLQTHAFIVIIAGWGLLLSSVFPLQSLACFFHVCFNALCLRGI